MNYKTVALILDGQAPTAIYTELFSRIRETFPQSKLICLMQGVFSSQALPFAIHAKERARTLYAAGADLVIEIPSLCNLLTRDVSSFSFSSLMQRCGIIDALILPCLLEEEQITRKASDMLFFEPLPYQKAMKALRKEGMSLEDHQFTTMESFLKDAGEDTSSLMEPQVQFEAHMLNALKKTYSPVKPYFLPVEKELIQQLYPAENLIDEEACLAMIQKCQTALSAFPSLEDAWEHAKAIYGSDPTLAELLYTSPSGPDLLSYTQALSEASASKLNRHTAREFRRFMLYLLGDFRFALNSILALHSYVPYIHVCYSPDMDEELIQGIRKANWAQVLQGTPDGILPEDQAKLDESLTHLLEVNERFHSL